MDGLSTSCTQFDSERSNADDFPFKTGSVWNGIRIMVSSVREYTSPDKFIQLMCIPHSAEFSFYLSGDHRIRFRPFSLFLSLYFAHTCVL
jgi:hypothetical protein